MISSLAGENVHRDHDGLPDILGSSLRCDLGQLYRRLEGGQEIHGTRGSKYKFLCSSSQQFFLFGAFPFKQKAVGGFPLITCVRWRSTWHSCMPSSMFISRLGFFLAFKFVITFIRLRSTWLRACLFWVFKKTSYGGYLFNNNLHQVAIHVAFVHAFVNPLLFLVLHPELRSTVMDILCCRLVSFIFCCQLIQIKKW